MFACIVFFKMPLTVKTNLWLSKGEFANQWVRRGWLHPSLSAAAVCLSAAKASWLLPLPAWSYSCSSRTLQMDYSSRAPSKTTSTGGLPAPLVTLKQQTSAAKFYNCETWTTAQQVIQPELQAFDLLPLPTCLVTTTTTIYCWSPYSTETLFDAATTHTHNDMITLIFQ